MKNAIDRFLKCATVTVGVTIGSLCSCEKSGIAPEGLTTHFPVVALDETFAWENLDPQIFDASFVVFMRNGEWIEIPSSMFKDDQGQLLIEQGMRELNEPVQALRCDENSCACDLNCSCSVNVADLMVLLQWFGCPSANTSSACIKFSCFSFPCNCPDLTGDGVVNVNDFLMMNTAFGTSC